jgi:hypothetical protein
MMGAMGHPPPCQALPSCSFHCLLLANPVQRRAEFVLGVLMWLHWDDTRGNTKSIAAQMVLQDCNRHGGQWFMPTKANKYIGSWLVCCEPIAEQQIADVI